MEEVTAHLARMEKDTNGGCGRGQEDGDLRGSYDLDGYHGYLVTSLLLNNKFVTAGNRSNPSLPLAMLTITTGVNFEELPQRTERSCGTVGRQACVSSTTGSVGRARSVKIGGTAIN
jgi:hypothetical protein